MTPCPALPDTPSARHECGFSLIELLIAVVVVGILAAIAFPSFMDSIRKSRRSEAFTALNNVQQAQERFRSNNANYTTNLTSSPNNSDESLRGLGLTASTPGGYYTIVVTDANATSYTVTATANTGTSQANDGDCAKLGVQLNGGNLQYAAASGSGSLSWGGANRCWSR
ncbi:MAG: hypothetical protein RLZZ598_716 [Pseudomonadota bacterium]|jgi:type IV pilus assembly protein PilE